ncbi:hypothetical protein [Moraxella lacunata]|uniref:hypothetical protein n=1 Tax=Moraxella lacunata TaxID=477 RepID=UPI003EE02544
MENKLPAKPVFRSPQACLRVGKPLERFSLIWGFAGSLINHFNQRIINPMLYRFLVRIFTNPNTGLVTKA